MYRALLVLAWLMAVGYSQVPTFWFLVHPFAERWRARRRSAFRFLVPVWFAEMAAAAAVTWKWHEVRLYTSLYAWIPASVLFGIGFWLYIAAHRGFTHNQLIGRAEIDPNHAHRLVVTGIRTRTRHPVYLAHLCEMLGWAIGSGLLVVYILLAYALVGFAFTIPQEDRELERRFGDAYRDYRRDVPALLPRIL